MNEKPILATKLNAHSLEQTIDYRSSCLSLRLLSFELTESSTCVNLIDSSYKVAGLLKVQHLLKRKSFFLCLLPLTALLDRSLQSIVNMPEPGGDDRAPDGAPSSNQVAGENNTNRNRNSRGGRRGDGGRARRPGTRGNTRFQGKKTDLKDHVYEITNNQLSSDLFAKTTREIAEHIARTLGKGAGEFINALDPDDLGFVALAPPAPPANPGDLVQLETWKLQLRRHDELQNWREDLSKQAYAIVKGQCSEGVLDRVMSNANYTQINNDTDVVALLGLIRESLYTGQTVQNPGHSLQEAEEKLAAFHQGARMTNHAFLEKFNGLVQILEHFGGEPGQDTARIRRKLAEQGAADEQNPTQQEFRAAKSAARNEYLAILFFRKSDKRRYGQLVRNVENAHVRGNNDYPQTISEAYNMLVNYRTPTRHGTSSNEGGLGFYTEGRGSGRGRGRGRGGRGGGRGGGRQGRGYGRHQPDEEHEAHTLFEEEDHDGDANSNYNDNKRRVCPLFRRSSSINCSRPIVCPIS